MKTDESIRELLSAWTAGLEEMAQQHRDLRSAMVAFAEGHGLDPTPLLDGVHAVRAECDALFRSLVWLIRDGRPAS